MGNFILGKGEYTRLIICIIPQYIENILVSERPIPR